MSSPALANRIARQKFPRGCLIFSSGVYYSYIQTSLGSLVVDFSKVTGFDWDEGNRDKNWDAHRVAWWEIEEVFFHQPLVVAPDPSHSGREVRFHALGHTKAGRFLQVVFTIRGTKIRAISARNMSRKERKVYGQATKKDAGF